MMDHLLGFPMDQRVHKAIATSHPEDPTMTSTLDQRINALRPGQEIRISGDTTIWVTAERSGDGKWVRFVRHTLNGFTVIRTARS